jgi:hypothetical protein
MSSYFTAFSCITLAIALVSCQYIRAHPQIIEDAEEVGEQLIEFEAHQLEQHTAMRSDMEKNTIRWASWLYP